MIIDEIDSQNVVLLSILSDDADRDDCHYVRQTMEEWIQGSYRFYHKGEILLGIFQNKECIALGGVCLDPYIKQPHVGRLRRVYVSSEERHKGIGTALVSGIIKYAMMTFTRIRLNTRNTVAAHLYESLGFKPWIEEKSTHTLEVINQPSDNDY